MFKVDESRPEPLPHPASSRGMEGRSIRLQSASLNTITRMVSAVDGLNAIPLCARRPREPKVNLVEPKVSSAGPKVSFVFLRVRSRFAVQVKRGRKPMMRLIAVATFALTVATSAQAMSPAPLHQPDGMITQVAAGCGVGRTRVNGICVARTTKRQVRRAVRRCSAGVTC